VISCLMPTYNKFPQSQALVEEGVESFLRQTYLDAELIICNDTPGQILVFEHPRVRIFNVAERYPTLGDKLNAMTTMASGDLLCRWDDDDISLEWGLAWRHKVLVERNADYVCPKRFWATNGQRTSFGYGSFAQCLYKREVHTKLGGYISSSFAEDNDFEIRAGRNGFKVLGPKITMEETFYFYRWGTGSEHLSGYGRSGGGWENIGKRPIQPGRYVLKPHWREDYALRAKRAIADHVSAQAKNTA